MNKEHITLRLDDALLQKIDALAQAEHKDRSEVITELILRAVTPAPAPTPAPGAPDALPDVLKSRLDTIAKWRQECVAEAAKRSRNFWLLTIPPLAVNAGYGCGLFNKIGLAGVQSLGLFISTMLMVVEKERPQNRLFTAFEKAALELEQLARALTEQWQAGVAAGTEPRHLLAQILTLAEKEEARVSKYIEDAESYMKETSLSRRVKSAAAKEFAAFR